jgi:gluconate 2-dehydrogenase gamma chain
MTSDPRLDFLQLNRRSLLTVATALFGTALIPELANALVKGGGRGLELQKPFFTTAERELVVAASDRIMPTTDTPGAKAAGVPEFIEIMLGEWYLPDDRNRIMTGIRALDAFAQRSGGLAFAAHSLKMQDELLTRVMRDKAIAADSYDSFFEEFRQIVLTGYFRSEIGVTIEQFYTPLPGYYDGSYQYDNVKKIITF